MRSALPSAAKHVKRNYTMNKYPNEPNKRKRKDERPDGLIQVSQKIGIMPNSKHLRKYFYGHTRNEIERKYYENYKSRIGLRYITNITIAEWVEVLNTYRTRAYRAYINSNNASYNRLVRALGERRMIDVRKFDLHSTMNVAFELVSLTSEKYENCNKKVFERTRNNKTIPDKHIFKHMPPALLI